MIIILSWKSRKLQKTFICRGENTGKYVTFTVPIEYVSYMLELIDSPRFMAGSLSNLVINLSEGNYRIKCKFGHDEKCDTCAIECKYL